MTNIKKLKESIIFGLKFLKNKNLNIGSEGNISLKTKNGFIISPTAMNPENMAIKDISQLTLDGIRISSSRPSSEWRIHKLIYKEMKNVNAIVHCHSEWSGSLSCLRKNIPSFHYMIAEFGGKNIKCSKYATFGTEKIAINILAAINNRKGCLIANHGQIVIGDNLEQALHLSEAMEKLSKQYYYCLLLGKHKLLKSCEMDEVLKLFASYKPKH